LRMSCLFEHQQLPGVELPKNVGSDT
jgi:hypothetical protein